MHVVLNIENTAIRQKLPPVPGAELFANADAEDNAAIDLLADKIDRQLLKQRKKRSKTKR